MGLFVLYKDDTLRDHRTEDEWDLKIFCEQTFHMLIYVDHTV